MNINPVDKDQATNLFRWILDESARIKASLEACESHVRALSSSILTANAAIAALAKNLESLTKEVEELKKPKKEKDK